MKNYTEFHIFALNDKHIPGLYPRGGFVLNRMTKTEIMRCMQRYEAGDAHIDFPGYVGTFETLPEVMAEIEKLL